MSAPMTEALVAVVPCYNPGGRLAGVIDKLQPIGCRVVLVDDGSDDGTVEAQASRVTEVVRHDTNRGKGHALLAGMRAAIDMPGCEAVVTLDADGQHDPAEIPRLFEAFQNEGADFVIGARTFGGKQVPFRSWIGNTVTVNVAGFLLGERLPDTQSGYRIHGRKFVEGILDAVEGGRYETEMEIIVKAVKQDYKVVSVPIQTVYEEGNASSHFKKVSDSIAIYKRLFRAVRKHRIEISG